ncbi:hypothetical protein [Xenorhabdus szentirmaii]|uniref:hypothetical protein n=1 Tax=Xenorhabdus szentirmaii TaxID=290112 RepID=UPI00117EDE07|nr:hypothetical protein [Xenorhabdus szentirmaii]
MRSAHSAPSDDHGAKRDQTHPPKKHRPEAGQSAESHARPSPRPSTKRRQTDTDAPSSPVKSADSRNAKLIMPPEVIMTHQKLPRGEGRRLPVGNETAMKHGRYATPRQADVD